MGKAEEVEKEHRAYLENHIEDLKTAIKKNRDVITQDVEDGLSEDKFMNVVKARRVASDDNLHYFKEIERLQGEINSETKTKDDKKDDNGASPVQRRSKK